MEQIEFQLWLNQHPLVENLIELPEGNESRWGRVKTVWHEKTDAKDLSHLCAFVVDMQTGDLFLDCSKRKIWTKCLALTIGRPILGLAKTAYHLALPISIPFEIFKAIYSGIQERESASAIAWNASIRVIHSFADIIRTPVYTTALLITTLAAVVIGPLIPSKLYDLRAIAGRIEYALTRGENLWTLAPCFQPIDDLARIDAFSYSKADTVYDTDPVLHGLNNLARSYVQHRRKVRNPFDNFGMLIPENTAYVSPACT